MELFRRRFLALAGAAAVGPAVPRIASSQDYPVRPVRLIVGFAAGGGTDIIARLTAQWLSRRLGQSFVVENRPGAATNVGTEVVVRAPPDGHTLLLVTAANAVNASLYDRLSFNFIRDIAPVGAISHVPFVMVVNPSFPARTVSDLIAYGKQHPGKLNMGSGGVGAPDHVAGELFKMLAGIDMVHVPYRGLSPALTDLLGGQVQVVFATLPSAVEHVRAGRLRPLALTTVTPSPALPDVPLLRDVVPGCEASQWYGIGAPKDTPTAIISKLNYEINAALADPGFTGRLADVGATAMGGSPADFGALIAEETDKWAKVVKFSGARPE
jgi:tripartite-type tricarboxylate transporter receptor subunit TctC